MTKEKFEEGHSYLARQLHVLDLDGHPEKVQDVAVVFTSGWVFVQEASSDGYVVPRERVLLVGGVRRAELPRLESGG